MSVNNPAAASGRLLRVVELTASSGTYTPGTGANSIYVRGVAAGHNGGTGNGSIGQSSAGGGGGGGSYFEDIIGMLAGGTLASSYAYTVGTTAGANTTFVATAGTYTANGGSVGVNGVSAAALSQYAGGAGGAISTGPGTPILLMAGEPGMQGITLSSAGGSGIGGSGGNSPLGAGGVGPSMAAVGGNATGYGSGGAGGMSTSGSSKAGGAFAPGILIIWEYA